MNKAILKTLNVVQKVGKFNKEVILKGANTAGEAIDVLGAAFRFGSNGKYIDINEKTIKKEIYVDCIKTFSDEQAENLNKVTKNSNKILVVLNDDAVKAYGLQFAMFTHFYVGTIFSPIIIVDNNFMDLEDDVQDFIIQHEIGHMVNGDISDDPSEAYKRNIMHELEADNYAVKVAIDETDSTSIAKFIQYSALSFFKILFDYADNRMGTSKMKEEIEIRIKNINDQF